MTKHIPHNENSRVKIPALVHFTRIGYEYLSLIKAVGRIDGDTNIFVDVFRDSINRINHTRLTETDAQKILTDLKVIISSDDLGKAFYSVLLNGYKGLKLIDFASADGSGNTFQVVTELTYKNGSSEFRPDITVLVNGLPLAFIEVKKPNNKEGIQAEYDRIKTRFTNEKFRRFANITQIMVFSNNSEYDDSEPVPLEGAFYAASGYGQLRFSQFREEDESIHAGVQTLDEDNEKAILTDTNLASIKGSPEYGTNSDPMTPTNRIITSLFTKKRLMMLLHYGIAYVDRTDDNGIIVREKHLMRYPQLFASYAIESRLNIGIKNGIIWHTQGSGKTALAYYNVRYLKDYYQKQGIIAKFYFIVDRLDLMTQAADEFRARGLIANEVDKKEDFVDNIRSTGDTNTTGKDSITVVNIQKFSKESVVRSADYNVNIQRIYFIDEAHRSYKPTGSFLFNLISSDRKAVMIALTGTPLLGTVYDDNGKPLPGKKYDSKVVFGNYIHKYYYNRSIADRYTLRLIREGISTSCRFKLMDALEQINLIKGSFKKKDVYAHQIYVAPLVQYIVDDFARSRLALGDNTIGGMIVCDTAPQARTVYEEMQKHPYTSALILYDEGDPETRKRLRDEFKKGSIDFLIVYNMLLTGFDAPRLKKLYLGRVIEDHNLLQALTRVNRPYKNHRFGYVVDFADIRSEFDKTNRAYFAELQKELGDAFQQYDSIFKTKEEIESDLQAIQDKLFLYSTDNAEMFSQEVSKLDDKAVLIELRQALESYKELYNIAKLFGYDELSDKFTLTKINSLYNEVVDRIGMINYKQTVQDAQDMSAILNLALDQIQFHFKKISENELVIADRYRDMLERTRQELTRTIDPKDPEYVTLLDELKRLLEKKHIEELTADEMTDDMNELERVRRAAEQKNLKDQMLCRKYANDVKYLHAHKRVAETPPPIGPDPVIYKVLNGLKQEIDQRVLSNEHLLDNEPFFNQSLTPLVHKAFVDNGVTANAQQVRFVSQCIADEYFSERKWAS